MGTNVTARQSGDAYQANFFWLKAAHLNHLNSNVSKVGWEITDTFGFDDVVVYYEPAKLDHGIQVSEEYFQLKYHVDYSKGFTCAALIDPEFIGAKKESILQRLYKIFKSDSAKFKRSTFNIVNTWGLDGSDVIGQLISNSGQIITTRLLEGGDKSKFGKVRVSWKEHLGITDNAELIEVLKPLRIKYGYDNDGDLKERLNLALTIAGLKIVSDDERSAKYEPLIRQLHKEGRNVFTKDDLMDICRTEDLLDDPARPGNVLSRIGIRSFSKGAENLHLEVDQLLCLQRFFNGRFIIQDNSWAEEIQPLIKEISESLLQAKKPVIIRLDTHLSISFYFGYCLDAKYAGLDITILQKTLAGSKEWKPTLNSSSSTKVWWEREIIQVSDNEDVALSISVTKDIGQDVLEYLSNQKIGVGKVLHFKISPQPSNTVIENADQITQAVNELLIETNRNRTGKTKLGRVHIFIAAPNAFSFFMGQLAKPLGKMTLYEFDFERTKDGSYNPVISLP